MDRPIADHELRRRALGTWIKVLAVVAVVVVGLLMLGSWLRPAVRLDRIRIAAAEQGAVEAATLCSGTVVPATEHVLPCPFDSRVVEVLGEPGAVLEAGQPLIRLDEAEVQLRVARLGDEIALKENRRRELALGLERRLAELSGRQEVERERLAFLEASTAQQRALDELGLAAVFALRQAELDERIARLELRQLGESMGRERESAQAQISGLEIELGLLRRDHSEQLDRLGRATVRADRAGVITWIADQEGAVLREGDVVARVADLSGFRIEASASDLHVNRFAVGMPVRVEVSGQILAGRVSGIPPAVDGGVMTLNIELENPSSPLLRSNLRVDVWVVTESRADAVRIPKGPFVSGSGAQRVFVVRDQEAIRVEVEIGVAGIEHYEILNGLMPGDRVIISDMSELMHVQRVRLR